MPDSFADRLLEAIEEKGAPICVGIDPIVSMFPANLPGHDTRPINTDDVRESIDAIFAFTTRVLKIVAPHAAAVKFQSAYFEQYLWEGVEAYYELIGEAAELGLLTIGDVKRGDIGPTAGAYAAAHLGNPSFGDMDELTTPDAITVNPMLGIDSLEPFIAVAKDLDKGLFILLRTSNPGSGQLQDVKLADGRSWSEMLADALSPLAADPGLVGSSGFSLLGAVVGATQPQTMQSLRRRLPQSIFLLPGYGAQGATAEMTRAAFIDGKGALVSASRSILYAYREKKYAQQFGTDWQRCVEQAVRDMKQELTAMRSRL